MLIAMPLFDRFTALDAIGPYEVLSRLPAAEVVFCGTDARTYRTQKGLGVQAGARLDDVSSCDVLVVPGGFGTRAAASNAALIEWIEAMHRTTTWTTSVCTGALLLGAAGLLRG
ncbi:MAG: DJ-1/PfpI family protein, partial [Actinomycetota bacterium]